MVRFCYSIERTLRNKIKIVMPSVLLCHLNTLMPFIIIVGFNCYKIQLNKEREKKMYMKHGKKPINSAKKLIASTSRICEKYMRDKRNQFNAFFPQILFIYSLGKVNIYMGQYSTYDLITLAKQCRNYTLVLVLVLVIIMKTFKILLTYCALV